MERPLSNQGLVCLVIRLQLNYIPNTPNYVAHGTDVRNVSVMAGLLACAETV